MSALTTAAAAVDTDITNLIADVATLVGLIQTSQTTYQNSNAGKYQQGLATFEDNIRAVLLKSSTLAQILKLPPTAATVPALATQFAAF